MSCEKYKVKRGMNSKARISNKYPFLPLRVTGITERPASATIHITAAGKISAHITTEVINAAMMISVGLINLMYLAFITEVYHIIRFVDGF